MRGRRERRGMDKREEVEGEERERGEEDVLVVGREKVWGGGEEYEGRG